jgi:hypothetical protein
MADKTNSPHELLHNILRGRSLLIGLNFFAE